jgi:hypothetical protein
MNMKFFLIALIALIIGGIFFSMFPPSSEKETEKAGATLPADLNNTEVTRSREARSQSQRNPEYTVTLFSVDDLEKLPGDQVTALMLDEMLWDVKPENYAAALNLIENSGVSAGEKLKFLRNLITTWSSYDFSEAFNIARSKSSYGNDKNKIIQSVFVGCSNPNLMMQKLSLLDFDDERTAAIEGIRMNLRNRVDSPLPDFSTISLTGDLFLEKELGSGLGERFGNVANADRGVLFETVIADIEDMVDSERASPKILESFLKSASNYGAENVFEWIVDPNHSQKVEGYGLDSWRPISQGYVDEVGGNAALSKITALNLADVPKAAEMSGVAFHTWLNKSNPEARAWLDENLSSLQGGFHDSIASSVVQYSLEQGEPELARQWANKIGNEETKRSLIDSIPSGRQE